MQYLPNSSVPAQGEKIERPIVVVTHPEYAEQAKLFRLYRDCYEADGGFSPLRIRIRKDGSEESARSYRETIEKELQRETYLVPHFRENGEGFKERLEQVFVPNFIKHRGITPLTGFLCNEKPDRQKHPSKFTDWTEECTDDGLDFDTWLSETGAPYGMIYGALPCLIDADPHNAETEAERKAMGADTAKLRIIHPDNVCDWQRDKKGKLVAIKYKAVWDEWTPLEGHKTKTRYCWVTEEGWWWMDDDENEAELPVGASGLWPWFEAKGIRRAPLCELRFMNGQSLLHDVAPIFCRLFNLASELTSLERKQGFSILCVQETEPQAVRKTGGGNYLSVPLEAGHMPEYVAPDPGPFTHLVAALELLIKWIQELFGTAPIFGAGAEAAATMAYRFEATRRFLIKLAKSLVAFEYEVAEIVMLWNGVEIVDRTMETVYGHSFDALEIERFMTYMTQAIQDIGMPPTWKAHLQEQTFTRVAPEAPDEIIEAGKKELELQKQEEANADEGPEDAVADDKMGITPPKAVAQPGDGRS